MVKLDTMRKEFSDEEKVSQNIAENPWDIFNEYLKKAFDIYKNESNHFVLSTAGKDGNPSSRVVLLKGIDAENLTFFTNYTSTKALELEGNPNVSCNFYWPKVECQIRIKAIAKKLSVEKSEEYFHVRPRKAQISAWASKQSSVLESRQDLLLDYEKYDKKFMDKVIPCPDFWGGYELSPFVFEFWFGRSSRLHDRIRYTKGEENQGRWLTERLAP